MNDFLLITQSTSKPPSLSKQDLTFSNIQGVTTNSSKSTKSVTFTTAVNEKSTEEIRSNRMRIRKTDKSTAKVLRKAGKELYRGKIMKEKDPRIIWREISGIDALKNATPIEGAVNTQEESTSCDIDGATSAPVCLQFQEDDEKASDEISVVESANKKSQSTTDVKSHVMKKRLNGLNDENTQQPDSNENGQKIRFAEKSDDKRKITRPTSAVIQRYIEKTKQKQTNSSDKKASSLTKRPMSSNPTTFNGRKRSNTKTRPASANVIKFSYPVSSSAKSKVVSAKVFC